MAGEGRNHILLVLFIGVLMGALDIAIVGPALPAIGEYFTVDTRNLTWIYTIYVLFFMVGTPLMAKLSDRWAGGLSIFWTWPYLGLVLSSPLLHHR